MKHLLSLLICLLAVLPPFALPAQEFPTKPVTLIVRYAPGGGTDLVARTVAEALSRKWGQNVLVENRPGATGAIAIRALKSAAPDGYTLGVWTDSDIGNAVTQDNLGYDLVQDFGHISQLSAGSTVLVANPQLKIKNFNDFVAYAKEHPNKLNFAVVTGGGMHLDSLRINRAAGVETAIVGYPGTGPGLTDVIAGHADLMLMPLGAALPHIQSGAVQPLAVGATERWPKLPDVQSLSETVPGLSSTFFHGLVGPKNMDPELKSRIHAAVEEVLRDPDLVLRFDKLGFIPAGSTPEQFKEFIATRLSVSRVAAIETGMKKN